MGGLVYATSVSGAVRVMSTWWRGGELRSHEQVIRCGVEDLPETLLAFRGANGGKMVLALNGDR